MPRQGHAAHVQPRRLRDLSPAPGRAQGPVRGQACAGCHVEGGTRTRAFTHNKDTRFPLVGFHNEPKVRSKCANCHQNEIYRTNKLACVDCHKKKTNTTGSSATTAPSVTRPPSISKTCASVWKHSKRFPLEGLHKTAKCEGCHVNGRYKLGDVTCGTATKRMTRIAASWAGTAASVTGRKKGAPKFNHDQMTHFVRDGAHRDLACSFCHRPRPDAPPAVGWTKKETAPPLDRRFPLMGKTCADCHADPHRGSSGLKCDDCHTTTDFRGLLAGGRIKPRDHDQIWLRSHANLPWDEDEAGAEGRACSRCHASAGLHQLPSLPSAKSHTALWRLRGHGPASAFDPEPCRVCHQPGMCIQCHRTTAPLNHRGAWGTVHGLRRAVLPTNNCYVCHRRADCLACHKSVAH